MSTESVVLTHTSTEIIFYSATTGEILRSVKLPSDFVYEPNTLRCKNSQVNDAEFCLTDDRGIIFVFDYRNEHKFKRTVETNGKVYSVDSIVFGDSNLLISGGIDNIARLWDVKDMSVIDKFDHSKDEINCVSFLDENSFVMAGDDCEIRHIDIKKKLHIGRYYSHTNLINDLYYSKKKSLLFSCSYDDTNLVIDLRMKKKVGQTRDCFEKSLIFSVFFHDDSNYLYYGSGNGDLACYDLRKIDVEYPSVFKKKISDHIKDVKVGRILGADNNKIVTGTSGGSLSSVGIWKLNGDEVRNIEVKDQAGMSTVVFSLGKISKVEKQDIQERVNFLRNDFKEEIDDGGEFVISFIPKKQFNAWKIFFFL